MGRQGAHEAAHARRPKPWQRLGRCLARRAPRPALRALVPGPGLLAALAGLLAAGALEQATPLVERLDEMAFDVEVGLARAGRDPAVAAQPEVVLVGIDEQSLDTLGVPLAMIHAELGAALESIAAGGPRAIGLDLTLPQQSFDPLRPGLDRALMRGLLAARNGGRSVVVALDADAQGRLRVPALALVAAAGGPESFGLTYFPLDCDGVVRRYAPDAAGTGPAHGCQVRWLGGAPLMGRAGAAAAPTPAGDGPQLPSFAARIAACAGAAATLRRAGWIDFTRGAPLHYLPLHRVLEWASQGAADRLRERFAGRIVLVGSVLPDLDRMRLPIELAAWESPNAGVPGLVVHAQVLRNALGHGLLEAPPRWVAFLLLGALAALGSVHHVAWRVGLVAAALPLLLLAGAAAQGAGWFCAPSQAWLAGAAAAGLRTALDLRRERLATRRLAERFGGYLSPQVMNALLRQGAQAGGTRRAIALLFADLRDFTAWSERTDPAIVLDLLNRYYGAVTPVLHAHGGVIDNFRGDGVMVMFGAPEPQEQPCAAAFAAARELCAAVAAFNAGQHGTGQPPLALGIGLAYGEVVFGDLGSAERRDFTALGDAVNVAARLQDLAKLLAVPVLMTEAFARQLPPDAPAVQPLGPQPLKGHTPVALCAWPAATAAAGATPGPAGGPADGSADGPLARA